MGLLPKIEIPLSRECVLSEPRFIPFCKRTGNWLEEIRLQRTQVKLDYHKVKTAQKAKTEKKVSSAKKKKSNSLLGMLTLEQMKLAGFIK